MADDLPQGPSSSKIRRESSDTDSFEKDHGESSDFSCLPEARKIPKSAVKSSKKVLKSRTYIDSTDSEGENATRDIKKKRLIKCDKWEYSAQTPSRVKRHAQTHDRESRHQCPEKNCQFTFSKFEHLDDHRFQKHRQVMKIENLLFDNPVDLKQWQNTMQENQFSKYTKRTNKSDKTQIYHCCRSAHLKQDTKSTGKRCAKKLGSIVSDKICSSRFKVVESSTGLKVTFYKSHCGHSTEPGKVGLTSPQKRGIARSIVSGVPKATALESLRSVKPFEVNRASLSNMQDIHNVVRKFKINSDVQLDENDAKSLHLTITRMKNEGDDGILLYKPQGVISDEYPELEKNDFLLAYMSSSQEYMLRKFGANIICMDGTHGMNSYGFELSSVMVLDDQHQGFPVLFFYHSNRSEDTYKLLFRKLKERIGEISCRVFMSDDEPGLYNAWQITGNVELKLLCTWHVLRNWRKHMKGFDAETRSRVYSELKAILSELDQVTFQESLKIFISKISAVHNLQTFHDYFVTYYAERTKEWAYCFRIGAGINVNMHIENMHRDIKHNYFHGKKVSRMDTSFSQIRLYLTNKQRDRLVSINRGKITTKDKNLRQRHTASLDLPITSILDMNDYWIVQSSRNPYETYKIHALKQDCMCSLICQHCATCLHAYKCSCVDSRIRTNMCKHVHLLMRYLKDNPKPDTDEPEDDDDSQLYIDTNDQMEMRTDETNAHLADFSLRNKIQDVDAGRKLVESYCTEALQLASTPEAMEVLVGCMKTVLATMARFKPDENFQNLPRLPKSCEAPNKNIEHQRFKSKKKKKNEGKKLAACSSNSEIISQMVLPVKIIPFKEAETVAD